MDITDVVAVLFHLFGGGTIPCEKAADVDDTGSLALTDAVYLLDFLFRRGLPPLAPFADCGFDRTPDDLGCAAAAACR